MVTRALLDTAVFVYAVGSDHPHRAPCRALVRALADERLTADISVEAVQEYIHVRTRAGIDRSQAVKEGQAIIALCRVHDVEMAHVQVAFQLFRTHPRLHLRDAIHAATALSCLADVIVTPDRALDHVPGLRRLDPVEAVAELLGPEA